MTSGFNYQEELSKCSTMEDITEPNGLVQRMVKDAIEQMLQSEMEDYITDEKSKGNHPRRNGTSPKKVKMSYVLPSIIPYRLTIFYHTPLSIAI